MPATQAKTTANRPDPPLFSHAAHPRHFSTLSRIERTVGFADMIVALPAHGHLTSHSIIIVAEMGACPPVRDVNYRDYGKIGQYVRGNSMKSQVARWTRNRGSR
jgi:hypothetical protein